jgi:pyridoxal 5'-phosphate synthase pdxT subunit
MDITVERNAYGRQIDSFVDNGECDKNAFGQEQLTMVFIRAPKIIDFTPDVTLLASCHGEPVLVQQANILAATFHPELQHEPFVHEYFVQQC